MGPAEREEEGEIEVTRRGRTRKTETQKSERGARPLAANKLARRPRVKPQTTAGEWKKPRSSSLWAHRHKQNRPLKKKEKRSCSSTLSPSATKSETSGDTWET